MTTESIYQPAAFSHKDEDASAGYYSVVLKEEGIKAELTVTAHAGMNRYTFYYYYQDLYALLEELLQEEAEKIIEAHHAFDLWQEGFLDAIAFVLEHRRAAYHVFNSNARAYVTRYFLRLGDFILTDVVRELSAGLPVSLEDRRILVDFYKHALVGVVSDWLEQGMKEDLSAVIRRIGVLLEGNIRRALENSIANG